MGYPDYEAQTGALGDVRRELERARAKFPAFESAHEGIAVLREEYLELEREVFWGARVHLEAAGARAHLRAEAIQVAAMALRFIEDVCDSRGAA